MQSYCDTGWEKLTYDKKISFFNLLQYTFLYYTIYSYINKR